MDCIGSTGLEKHKSNTLKEQRSAWKLLTSTGFMAKLLLLSVAWAVLLGLIQV